MITNRIGWRHAALAAGVAGLMFSFAACGDDDDKAPAKPDLVDLVISSPQLSTLEQAVIAADLVNTLRGPGPFTVFAPVDSAFAALPSGTLEGLLADKAALTEVLTYHVVAGRVDAAAVVGLTSATTVQGQAIAISVNDAGEVVLNGSVKVITTDIEATNGLVHLIDGVLLPPAPTPSNTIVDIVVGDTRFSTLTAAVVAAGLDAALASPGPFTVFAPTDEAFAKLPAGTIEALLADLEALTGVLTYHAVPGSFDAAAVSALTEVTTVNGAKISIEVVDGAVILNGSVRVTQADLRADNGIIHVIDTVLLPPEPAPVSNTIVDIVVGSADFTTLEAAVTAAGLVDTLAGDGPFTVFAPTDAAFAALPAGTLDALLADLPTLTDILTYHVVSGAVDAATVVGLDEATALNGAWITIDVVGGEVILNGSVKVTQTDIIADNGIIHVIDAVLLPPPTVAEVVASDADFSTLLAAVSAAGLVDALDGPGPFTVFAPTNAAFALVPEADLNALLADVPALTDVLLYHVLDGEARAAEVVSATHFTMKNGALAWIDTDGGASISGVAISAVDIRVRNGVIHVIDAVMIPPPTLTELAVGTPALSTLVTAVLAADLADTLATAGPFTVFAPTDAAFAALPAGALEGLLADIPALTDVLTYHLVDGVVPASVAVGLTSAIMLNGDAISLAVTGGELVVNGGATVVAADIWARNGVVHVIDAVLLPPE